jgi:hypothetical protein
MNLLIYLFTKSSKSNHEIKFKYGTKSILYSYNNMTELGSFGPIPTLLDFHVTNNKIKRISNSAVTRMASLRELHLANNNLKAAFQVNTL